MFLLFSFSICAYVYVDGVGDDREDGNVDEILEEGLVVVVEVDFDDAIAEHGDDEPDVEIDSDGVG